METKKECKQYLAEYHQDLFFRNVNKHYRAMTDAELRKCLSRSTEASLGPLVKSNELSDVYAMLSKVRAHFMCRKGHLAGPVPEQWESSCRQTREFRKALARKSLEYVNGLSREDLGQVLKMQGVCRYLPINSLERAYQLFYIPKAIKRGILESVKQRPEQEYPGVGEVRRMFILHVDPTNSSKTHGAPEHLKECRHGIYFGPLRLSALEVYDRLNTGSLSCSTVTGEKTLKVPGAVCQFCTVEMLSGHRYFDIVVVGGCQMIANPYRERNWTRAVLGLRTKEVHPYMTPEAEDIVVQMVRRRGDRYGVMRHKRGTRLTIEREPCNLERDLKEGNALVVFSRKSMLALATHLENEGIHCSAVYGSLPLTTRYEQACRFLARETEVVVSTDAIDMRLNLPIRRIMFVGTHKFDGVNKRTLNPEEIEQIAGRAGRYGLYDEGSVAAIDKAEIIEDGLSRVSMPAMKAYVGLPKQFLNLPAEIDMLVRIQTGMDMPSTYEKMKVGELLALYMNSEHAHRDDMGEYSWQETCKLIACSIDIDNKMVMDPWRDCRREYHDVTELEFLYNPGEDLYESEDYYKILDLYSQFSGKVGFPVQAENLAEERRGTEEEVSHILGIECAGYTRECSARGGELPWDCPFSVCGRCFERDKISRGHNRSGRKYAAGNRV